MATWWPFASAVGLNQRGQPLTESEQGFVLEAQNLTFTQDGACVQRFGSIEQDLTGASLTGEAEWVGRNITEDGTEERWIAADNGTSALAMNNGTGWTPVTFSDTADPDFLRYMQAASLNGKYFLAYKSNVNRLHVWDGTSVRRVGFAEAPQVSPDQMTAGALSFTRWYRMRYIELDSDGFIVRRSEPGDPVAITIANKVGVTVTKGAAINEGETDWELEAAALEAGPWYRINTQVVGNTQFDDTSATIDDTNLSALLGAYVPPPSAKYLLSDGQRLLLAGAWETVAATGQTEPQQNRLWYTPVLGTTDEGDDERIPDTVDQANWLDIGDAGPLVGIAGPLYGEIYTFKTNAVWKLVPLEDFDLPYRPILVTDALGAIDQRLMCSGEQGNGVPALYFASNDTISRISQGGIVDLSESISRDLRFANFSADQSLMAFDPYDHTLFVQSNIGSSATPGQYFQFKLDIKNNRWTGIVIGEGGAGWIMGRSILGTPAILGPLGIVPRNAVIAQNDNGQIRLQLCGSDADGNPLLISSGDQCGLDADEAMTSVVRVRRFTTPGFFFQVGSPTVIYRNPIGTTETQGVMTVQYIRDDDSTMSQTLPMEATDPDNPVSQKRLTFSGLQLDASAVIDVRVMMTFTAAFLSAIPPSIDAVVIPWTQQEAFAA